MKVLQLCCAVLMKALIMEYLPFIGIFCFVFIKKVICFLLESGFFPVVNGSWQQTWFCKLLQQNCARLEFAPLCIASEKIATVMR